MMDGHMIVDDLKEEVDKLSEKWNAAKVNGNLQLKEEIGDTIHFYLQRIERETKEWYRPKYPVDNL